MRSDATIQIQLNGLPREIGAETVVSDLIRALELVPEAVAVEVNQRLVPRRMRDATRLSAGDRVEIVTLVGGG
jgi:sulfur carrier protein